MHLSVSLSLSPLHDLHRDETRTVLLLAAGETMPLAWSAVTASPLGERRASSRASPLSNPGMLRESTASAPSSSPPLSSGESLISRSSLAGSSTGVPSASSAAASAAASSSSSIVDSSNPRPQVEVTAACRDGNRDQTSRTQSCRYCVMRRRCASLCTSCRLLQSAVEAVSEGAGT